MRVVLFIAVGLVTSTIAHAGVQYTVTPNGGLFSYGFTLANDGSADGILFDLFISIPLDIGDINSATIGTPIGWGDPTGGLLFFGSDVAPSTSFIEWADDISGLYDVETGDSLSGFSFESSKEVVGPILFAFNGSTALDPATEIVTPEPKALVLLLTAALIWCLVFRRNLHW